MMLKGCLVRRDVPLRMLTTLGIGGPASYVVDVHDPEALPRVLDFATSVALPFVLLGEGSNVLAADEGYRGVVIRMVTKGCKVEPYGQDDRLIQVEAGENWDQFTAFCAASAWWGVENMAGIPGTVGALPVQNAGAYGQEAADVVVRLKAWDTREARWCEKEAEACAFAYRTSIFNALEADRYIITQVTFRLYKLGRANLSHTALAALLAAPSHHASGQLTPDRVRQAVLALRGDGRLPDCRHVGNAGSFFKNLVVTESELLEAVACVRKTLGEDTAKNLESLARRFSRPEGFKVPVGILIKSCGLANLRVGGAALFDGNPLVVINANGHATAREIITLADQIRCTVYDKSGLKLLNEPRLLGFSP